MSFELEILNQLQKLHTPVVDKIMVFITNLGSAGIIWIILTVVCLIIPRTRKAGWVMAASLIVDLILCNGILKNLVARTRPCDVNKSIQLLVKRPWDYSFPSGHTAASFASVTALYLAGEKKLWKPVLVLGCVIAFSRMYLYVHYPTDIIGGIVTGIASGILGPQIFLNTSPIFHLTKRNFQDRVPPVSFFHIDEYLRLYQISFKPTIPAWILLCE